MANILNVELLTVPKTRQGLKCKLIITPNSLKTFQHSKEKEDSQGKLPELMLANIFLDRKIQESQFNQKSFESEVTLSI